MSTTPSTSHVFQSRWGYHPIDYPTLLAFKRLHALMLRDLQATRRRKRWEAKLPSNRIRRFKDGGVEPIPRPVCVGTELEDYLWVLEEYRQARRPQASPSEVSPFDPPHDWRERLATLESPARDGEAEAG